MVEEAWTLDRAKEFCEKYGLELKITGYKETNEVEENIVLAQYPKKGTEIFEKDTLKIVVSKKVTETTTTTTTSKTTSTTTTTTTKAEDKNNQ